MAQRNTAQDILSTTTAFENKMSEVHTIPETPPTDHHGVQMSKQSTDSTRHAEIHTRVDIYELYVATHQADKLYQEMDAESLEGVQQHPGLQCDACQKEDDDNRTPLDCVLGMNPSAAHKKGTQQVVLCVCCSKQTTFTL